MARKRTSALVLMLAVFAAHGASAAENEKATSIVLVHAAFVETAVTPKP